MARRIPARRLSETDVLEFVAMTPDGIINGLPIERLIRHRDGRVEVDVTYPGGTRCHTFGPDELVEVQ